MNTTAITCTRRLQFCAGHRVMGHESKCRHLHGHNYVVWLTARALVRVDPLDSIGRVVDFSVLKYRVGEWIQKTWDHGFILHKDDKSGLAAVDAFSKAEGINQKVAFLPYNPTAENIALFLLEVVGPTTLQGLGVELVEVKVDETENCSASVERSYP